jgi:hypothetical protein
MGMLVKTDARKDPFLGHWICQQLSAKLNSPDPL